MTVGSDSWTQKSPVSCDTGLCVDSKDTPDVTCARIQTTPRAIHSESVASSCRCDEAKVSVFDSGFVLGDGIWEGLRVHHGKIAFMQQHMDRLYEGAKALDMEMDVSAAELEQRLYRVLEANEMHEGVHIRLMVSRGVKATPYQDPRITITPPTIVIIPEYKEALPETAVWRGFSALGNTR